MNKINVEGSPPPMRGKGHSVLAFSKVLRDHPRLCGEKPFLRSGTVRGTRITPAYAGKSIVAYASNSST